MFLCQVLLLKDDALQMLRKVMERCFGIHDVDRKQIPDSRNFALYNFSFFTWYLPVFKFITLMFHSGTSQSSLKMDG